MRDDTSDAELAIAKVECILCAEEVTILLLDSRVIERVDVHNWLQFWFKCALLQFFCFLLFLYCRQFYLLLLRNKQINQLV